jgi:hypothetical protein
MPNTMIRANNSKKQKTVILKQAFNSFVIDLYENDVNKPHYYERITDLMHDMPCHINWLKASKYRRLQVCGLLRNENKEEVRWVLFSLGYPALFEKYQSTDPMKQTVFPHTKV